MEMNYCVECGAKLLLRRHPGEGHEVPWCESCGTWRYPIYNTP